MGFSQDIFLTDAAGRPLVNFSIHGILGTAVVAVPFPKRGQFHRPGKPHIASAFTLVDIAFSWASVVVAADVHTLCMGIPE